MGRDKDDGVRRSAVSGKKVCSSFLDCQETMLLVFAAFSLFINRLETWVGLKLWNFSDYMFLFVDSLEARQDKGGQGSRE